MSAIAKPVPQTYGVERWGEGYFGINEAGHVTVRPFASAEGEIDLARLVDELGRRGLRLPILVRFNAVLRHRVEALCAAFRDAGQGLGFDAGYRAIYPIKVNQQRSVVDEIVAVGGEHIGLEAGSKPELLAVLAHAPKGAPIVCNGYKDREYVRLALIGQRLGHEVFIVIEKPSELDLVLAESTALGVAPRLGVRVRLASIASGKWQNSGGAKSKFGLSATQLLEFVDRLERHDALEWLVMLHSHIGSQIPDLRDVHRGVAEVAQLYVQLHRLGAPVRVVDVGGGLAVDYEGSGSEDDYSMNYDLAAYAAEVLRPIVTVCRESKLPAPMIFSESGRAMTAHHAVLITEIIGEESPGVDAAVACAEDDDELLHRLADQLDCEPGEGLPRRLRTAQMILDEIQSKFAQGQIDLRQRAKAESLFLAVTRQLRGQLRLGARRHREMLDELDGLLADRVFCNFSLFQSLPDVWAIDQVFPIMPLQRLDEPPMRVARLHDLTCDSDGCIDRYVDQDGVDHAIPLHETRPGERYRLAVFLVGAYQEILGDCHNLFGDTDAVSIQCEPDGGYRVDAAEPGDSVDQLLRYVHFDPERMLIAYGDKLSADISLSAKEIDSFLAELRAGLGAYTYLVTAPGDAN